MSFLGHVVDADGIDTDPEKVRAIALRPEPTNLEELFLRNGQLLPGSYPRLCCYGHPSPRPDQEKRPLKIGSCGERQDKVDMEDKSGLTWRIRGTGFPNVLSSCKFEGLH